MSKVVQIHSQIAKSWVWSSGKVISEQSVNVDYKEPALLPSRWYYWQVRIWDNKGKLSEWSTPAWWETALVDHTKCQAEWIVAPGKSGEEHRPSYFGKEFACGKKVLSARLYINSLGLYQVFVNSNKVANDLFTSGWTSYNKRLLCQTYNITNLLKAENAVGAIVGDGWYRGNIGGEVQWNYYGDQMALLAQVDFFFRTEQKK